VFLYVGIHVAVFMLEVFPSWAAWRQEWKEKMVQSAPGWLKEVFEHADEEEEERTLEKRRKLLLLLAILAASLTYQAGMSPPGGFWQESKPGHHVAGDPVLNDQGLSTTTTSADTWPSSTATRRPSSRPSPFEDLDDRATVPRAAGLRDPRPRRALGRLRRW
jgi:hypothetical protein